MAFNSSHFIWFFLAAFTGYYLCPPRHRWMWLLGASIYFYGIWQPLLLALVLAATGVGYWLALKIEAEPDKPHRKKLTTAAIVLLVSNLLVFKYTSFVNESIRSVLGWVDVPYGVPYVQLILPLGISFYTFQLISYVVDVHRKTVPAERHFGIFALYVMFFPKLVAGPIERAKGLIPQLHEHHRFDDGQVASGLQLAGWGMFKKAVIADRLGPFVQQVYDDPAGTSGVDITAATFLFAVQIYADFSGYTDMALGTAQMLGIRLSPNFRRPYFAASVSEFWKRWHISLTSWLNDYLYTPMTRTRKIKLKWYYLMLVSLFLTFLVSGLWHGAQWTFVAWGALHGAYLVAATMTQKWRRQLGKRLKVNRAPQLHHAGQVLMTFGMICFAYILFQAKSMSDAWYMIVHLPTGWGSLTTEVRDFVNGRWAELSFAAFGTAVLLTIDILQERGSVREWVGLRPMPVRWALSAGLATSIALLGAFYDQGQQFIYFQF